MTPTWIKAVQLEQTGTSPSGKTKVWDVFSVDGRIRFGTIRWYLDWRKYAFFPDDGAILEQNAMREIATFMNEQTIAKTFRRPKVAS